MKKEIHDRFLFSPDINSHSSRQKQAVSHPETGDVFIPPHLEDDPLYVSDLEQQEGSREEERRLVHRMVRGEKREKIRKKKRKNRQRRLWAIAAGLIVFLLWLFFRLAPVPFGALIVDGNDAMSFEDVYRACGVGDHVNVIQLAPDKIQERLQKDLRIADARVEREFPATIRITMKERKAVAVITTMYGFAYIDQTGTVIELGPQIKGVSVPIITGKKVDTLLLGDTISDGPIHAAMDYLQALPPYILQTIAEVNVGNPNQVIAYTSDSLPIHLEKGDNPLERAAITEELLQEVKNNNLSVQYIDTDVKAPRVKNK